MTGAIDMANRRIGHLHVLHREASNGRRAMWRVRCTDCRHEFAAGGTTLRKAERGVWRVLCPGCEADV
jgi:hypothetical protein